MATQGFSTIGLDVKVNNVSLNYVTDISDIGGAPSELDATCMKDSMKKTVPGVQDTASFEGTVFATTGYVSLTVSGAKVDELVSAKLTVNLQSDWTVTNPAN